LLDETADALGHGSASRDQPSSAPREILPAAGVETAADWLPIWKPQRCLGLVARQALASASVEPHLRRAAKDSNCCVERCDLSGVSADGAEWLTFVPPADLVNVH